MEQSDYSEQEHSKPSKNQNSFPTPKTQRNDQTKRFSDEQVKLLESRFNRQAKLESRSKLQLAKDLGLQPRQVSIWFQNKRARWKSKKLEQEYRVLRANFDDLNQQFQFLKKENESLLEQLHKLKNLLENSKGRQKSRKKSKESTLNTAPANREKNNFEHRGNGNSVGISEHLGQKEEEEAKFDKLIEQGESSFASANDKQNQRCNLVSSWLVDESCCPSSWWDF